MNFYENSIIHEDAYIITSEDFETLLVLRYNYSSSMSITYFFNHFAGHNPEIVHYLQLHYPEYLL